MTKYLQFSQICFNKGKVKVKCLGDKAAGSMCGRGEIYLVSGRWSIDNCLNVNYYQKKRPVQLLDVRGEHSVEDGKWPCLYKLHRLKHLLNDVSSSGPHISEETSKQWREFKGELQIQSRAGKQIFHYEV